MYDGNGELVATQQTNAEGAYCFKDLVPGEYCVKEIQPVTFIDGKDSIGSVQGLTAGHVDGNDSFCVTLNGGDKGVNYDFGEIRLGSISGTVHADVNGDCVFDASEGDQPLADVVLILMDADGNEVTRTLTDAEGNYAFNDLEPGTYTVREFTPDGYIDGAEMIGDAGGSFSMIGYPTSRLAQVKPR